MKKTAFLLIAFLLAAVVCAQTPATKKHEVQAGETLYSIARQYSTPVQTLLQLNPGLEADRIMAGQTLLVPAAPGQTPPHSATPVPTAVAPAPVAPKAPQAISVPNRPKYKTLHEVKKKETVYSISRQYDVTESELLEANPSLKTGKLKKGAVLNIPYTSQENAQYQEAVRRAAEEARKPKVQKYDAINVAVILPFAKNEEHMTAESQKMANLYQGFLLAVDSLKQRGYNVNVYAYDESSAISGILQQPVLQQMQLIVGPMRKYNISPVATFANTHHIAHVVPLANAQTVVDERPNTFQVNVPSSLIHSQVYNRFAVMHRGENIVFVQMADRNDNPAYIREFQKALQGFSFTPNAIGIEDLSSLTTMLKENQRNVLIPSSGSAAAFETLCKKLNSLELPDAYKIQLFGYPEWQTLTAKHDEQLRRYNAQFFTSFFSNNSAVRTQQFNQRFQQWFRQGQYYSVPRYGELGYDIGAYFIKGLHDYGSAFSENLHSYSYQSLEFPFNFEKKNPTSGFQNRTVLIVTHRPDGGIVIR